MDEKWLPLITLVCYWKDVLTETPIFPEDRQEDGEQMGRWGIARRTQSLTSYKVGGTVIFMEYNRRIYINIFDIFFELILWIKCCRFPVPGAPYINVKNQEVFNKKIS